MRELRDVKNLLRLILVQNETGKDGNAFIHGYPPLLVPLKTLEELRTTEEILASDQLQFKALVSVYKQPSAKILDHNR